MKPNLRGLRAGRSTLRVAWQQRTPSAAQDDDERFLLYAPPPAFDRLLAETELTPLPAYKARRCVHRDGDWHRSVEVWLQDGGYVVVQQRSALKDTHPGRFDVACAGHVADDASVLDAAKRELDEELGLRQADLVPCFIAPVQACDDLVDNELVYVFLARLDLAAARFTLSPSEVAGLEVRSTTSVLDDLRRQSAAFVPKPPHYVEALAALLCS